METKASRGFWRGVLVGGLGVGLVLGGILSEFVLGTWYPEPGMGAFRPALWAGSACALFALAYRVRLWQRGLLALTPAVICMSFYASPWPMPRKAFFRTVDRIAVGMSRSEVARVMGDHLRGHPMGSTFKPESSLLWYYRPRGYNGIIGDSDYAAVSFVDERVTDVAADVD